MSAAENVNGIEEIRMIGYVAMRNRIILQITQIMMMVVRSLRSLRRGDQMNARQKLKKLKKELAEKKDKDFTWLKQLDGTHGYIWLKVDGIGIKREDPRPYFENNLLEFIEYRQTYIIHIGSMRLECTPMNPEDTLLTINSKEFDATYDKAMKREVK